MLQVGIVGFYGMGNLGDDAMARAIGGAVDSWGMSPHVVSYKEHHKWRYRVRDLDALIVGGGSLGPGFGWPLVCEHLLSGHGAVAAIGQSYSEDWLDPRVLGARMLEQHALVCPRDYRSTCVLQRLGVAYSFGADPALLLPRPEPSCAYERIAFIRHPNREWSSEEAGRALEDAVSGQYQVMCCERQDWEWLHASGVHGVLLASEESMRANIAGAKRVMSAGRYHPALFAHAYGVECEERGSKLVRLHPRGQLRSRAVDMLCKLKELLWRIAGSSRA